MREHMEKYCLEWEDRRKSCHEEVEELAERISKASLEHEEQWQAIDADRKAKMNDIELRLSEYVAEHESQLRELDETHGVELASYREAEDAELGRREIDLE